MAGERMTAYFHPGNPGSKRKRFLIPHAEAFVIGLRAKRADDSSSAKAPRVDLCFFVYLRIAA